MSKTTYNANSTPDQADSIRDRLLEIINKPKKSRIQFLVGNRNRDLVEFLSEEMIRVGCPTVTNMSEQMFLWMNPDFERICGCGSNQPKKFISYDQGYHTTCGIKCGFTRQLRKEQRAITNKKIGKMNAGKKRGPAKKYTQIENHEHHLCQNGCGQIASYQSPNGGYWCSDSPNRCPSSRAKKRTAMANRTEQEWREVIIARESTFMKNFGATNPQKDPLIRQRTLATHKSRYGESMAWNRPEAIEKAKQSRLESIGVEFPLQSPEIMERIKKTNMQAFGAEFPTQSPAVLKKMLAAGFRLKDYRFGGSDNVYQIQGYEHHVLDFLQDLGLTEEDIQVETPMTLKYEHLGKEHRYLPDIMIPKWNLLIEVKSLYTFSIEIEKNISKHEASLEQGWNHLIVVVYPKEESWKTLFLERLRFVLGDVI